MVTVVAGSGEGGGGGYSRTTGLLYILVMQSVHGLETWVMYPRIGILLGGFHHRLVRRLTGRKPRNRTDGTWVYPPLEESM